MKTSDYISLTINRIPRGHVFTYADFNTEANKKEAVIKALNRMTASGKLVYYLMRLTGANTVVSATIKGNHPEAVSKVDLERNEVRI